MAMLVNSPSHWHIVKRSTHQTLTLIAKVQILLCQPFGQQNVEAPVLNESDIKVTGQVHTANVDGINVVVFKQCIK